MANFQFMLICPFPFPSPPPFSSLLAPCFTVFPAYLVISPLWWRRLLVWWSRCCTLRVQILRWWWILLLLAILLISRLTTLLRRWRVITCIFRKRLGSVTSLVIVVVPTDGPTSNLHHLPTTTEEYHQSNDTKGKKGDSNTDPDSDLLTTREAEDVWVALPDAIVVASVV